jgi:hypothetical protein
METKATRLEELSACVQVPAFIRVARRDVFSLKNLPAWEQYIVRGVSESEDQGFSSHAGQFITLGPIARGHVVEAMKSILQHPAAIEVIVQEYRQGISGVAFCFNESLFYAECSACPEGVTSGKIRPFVAILPTDHGSRYGELQGELLKIYRQFGPCDVEFIGIENPAFVQVRPITSVFDVDREMAALQMALQDSISGRWVENDLAHVIGEHKKFDSVFVSAYMRSLTSVFKQFFNRSIDISVNDVISVGSQYFVSEHFIKSTTLGWLDLLRFALVFHREQEHLKNARGENVSLEKLFEKSILSSMAYTFLKKKKFLDIREEYRRAIDARLASGHSSEKDIKRFSYGGQLDSIIELDRDSATWTAIKERDSFGLQVVPGEFDKSKFFSYQEGREIPAGAVVLCDNLYPDIGRSIDTLHGILCTNGSINSHVAILCRERNIPLVIQADVERYRS